MKAFSKTITPLAPLRCLALVCLVLAGTVASHAQITNLGSFSGFPNAFHPEGGLTLIGSTLYGITESGGADNIGAVFSVPVSGGTPTLLGSFTGPPTNGSNPTGSLTLIGSTFYFTSLGGGATGGGGVFSMPMSGGTVTLLGSFSGTANGSGPQGSLTLSGSTLYGTTAAGGATGNGGVFSVPVSGGTPTLLGSFSGTANGSDPRGSLTLIGSTLYGTTSAGGANGNGGVFSVPVGGGTPTLLGSFSGAANGSAPAGDLTLSGDGSTFYGTTSAGGANGDGGVFSVPVGGGTPTLLGSFSGTANGAGPEGSLTLVGSTLYGTTSAGGANNDGGVFSVPVSGGTPTLLGSFSGAANGSDPQGSLTLIGSTLYGTTTTGGANGDGVLFSVPVPEPGSATLVVAGLLAVSMRRRRRAATV